MAYVEIYYLGTTCNLRLFLLDKNLHKIDIHLLQMSIGNSFLLGGNHY